VLLAVLLCELAALRLLVDFLFISQLKKGQLDHVGVVLFNSENMSNQFVFPPSCLKFFVLFLNGQVKLCNVLLGQVSCACNVLLGDTCCKVIAI
jgi:hypothetical protein